MTKKMHYSLESYESACKRHREKQKANSRSAEPMVEAMLLGRYGWPHEDHPMNYQFNAIGIPMIKLKDD